MINPFTPESDQCQNSPATSQEIWHSRSMENLTLHSLLRWKVIILYKFSLRRSYNCFLKFGRIHFLSLGAEGLKKWLFARNGITSLLPVSGVEWFGPSSPRFFSCLFPMAPSGCPAKVSASWVILPVQRKFVAEIQWNVRLAFALPVVLVVFPKYWNGTYLYNYAFVILSHSGFKAHLSNSEWKPTAKQSQSH